MSFEVKDSGERVRFDSGMVRDIADDKTDYSLIYDGPMIDRWAEHISKGAKKYTPRNWMMAQGDEEAERFKSSAARHFRQWMRGDQDEDHAAAVYFNINGYEYVKAREKDNPFQPLRKKEPEWTEPVQRQPAVYVGPRRPTLTDLGPVDGYDLENMGYETAQEFAEDYNYMRDRVLELEDKVKLLEAQLAAQTALAEAYYRH